MSETRRARVRFHLADELASSDPDVAVRYAKQELSELGEVVGEPRKLERGQPIPGIEFDTAPPGTSEYVFEADIAVTPPDILGDATHDSRD